MEENPHNRRKFVRVPLETKVSIVLDGVDARVQHFVENVSAGGLFIRTESPRPIGSKIRFEFLVRDGGPKVVGSGVVQWAGQRPGEPSGMGIRFLELNEEGRQEILEALRKRRGTGG